MAGDWSASLNWPGLDLVELSNRFFVAIFLQWQAMLQGSIDSVNYNCDNKPTSRLRCKCLVGKGIAAANGLPHAQFCHM